MSVVVMLNSNFFQNQNTNPKNRLKLETCFLLYPSSMVKRVRISTFDFHIRFVDRRSVRSAHIKRSEDLTCARSDSDSVCGRHAACQIELMHSQQYSSRRASRRHSNTSAVSPANGWGRGEGRECCWSTDFTNLRFLSSVV